MVWNHYSELSIYSVHINYLISHNLQFITKLGCRLLINCFGELWHTQRHKHAANICVPMYDTYNNGHCIAFEQSRSHPHSLANTFPNVVQLNEWRILVWLKTNETCSNQVSYYECMRISMLYITMCTEHHTFVCMLYLYKNIPYSFLTISYSVSVFFCSCRWMFNDGMCLCAQVAYVMLCIICIYMSVHMYMCVSRSRIMLLRMSITAGLTT